MNASAPWALLVIDMQNDFVRPGAVLCVQGAEATLPSIRRACDWFRARAWPVIWVMPAFRSAMTCFDLVTGS